VCGPVVFEDFDVPDKLNIAVERRRDRITCSKCRAASKERAQEIKCRTCQTLKPLCDFPETVEEHVARRHLSYEDAILNMQCRSCTDEHTHRVCSECNVRTPRDRMACKKGTKRILDRCADCAFPACVSCGVRRDVKDGPICKKDTVVGKWYCGCYRIVSYCIILYCIVLYCIAPYCIVVSVRYCSQNKCRGVPLNMNFALYYKSRRIKICIRLCCIVLFESRPDRDTLLQT
jgi:hypothetical protein